MTTDMYEVLQRARASRDLDGLNEKCRETVGRALLWSILVERVLDSLPRSFHFCDVGAGDGWWSSRILREYPEALGMALAECPESVGDDVRGESSGSRQRLEIASLESRSLSSFRENSFDLTLNLGHLLWFSTEPERVLRELVRITRPGGCVVSLVPNMHHAISCLIAQARIPEAERALAGRASLLAGMPESVMFTGESIETLVMQAGARPEVTVGLPLGADQSAGVEGEDRGAVRSESLWDAESSSKVLAIEKQLLGSSALRGNVLLSIARVPEPAGSWAQYWLPDTNV